MKAESANCQSCEQNQQEIESLKERLQVAEELANKWKLAELEAKRNEFLAKTKQEDWSISEASQEDLEFLFEEFSILPLLSKLNALGYSEFDDFMLLGTQTIADSVEISLLEASGLAFNLEVMANGIFTKEDKEKHLQSCAICRMGVKKGLEEYGVASKDSGAIAEKLTGLNLGEVMTLVDNFTRLGIDKSHLLSLGAFFFRFW